MRTCFFHCTAPSTRRFSRPLGGELFDWIHTHHTNTLPNCTLHSGGVVRERLRNLLKNTWSLRAQSCSASRRPNSTRLQFMLHPATHCGGLSNHRSRWCRHEFQESRSHKKPVHTCDDWSCVAGDCPVQCRVQFFRRGCCDVWRSWCPLTTGEPRKLKGVILPSEEEWNPCLWILLGFHLVGYILHECVSLARFAEIVVGGRNLWCRCCKIHSDTLVMVAHVDGLSVAADGSEYPCEKAKFIMDKCTLQLDKGDKITRV